MLLRSERSCTDRAEVDSARGTSPTLRRANHCGAWEWKGPVTNAQRSLLRSLDRRLRRRESDPPTAKRVDYRHWLKQRSNDATKQ